MRALLPNRLEFLYVAFRPKAVNGLDRVDDWYAASADI